MRALLLFAVLCSACVNHRDFVPRENRNGEGPGGHPAAVYPLGGAPSAGEVRVWSAGARGVDTDGAEVVEVRVGFELENTGAVPLVLDTDAVRCDEVWIGDLRSASLAPARVDGASAVAPGSSGRVEVAFVVAEAGRARDVDGFTVRFRVLAGGEPVLVQATPFVPYRREWRDDDWRWRSTWGWGVWWYHPLHGSHCVW